MSMAIRPRANIKEAIQACLESLAEDEIKSYITNPSFRVVDVVA